MKQLQKNLSARSLLCLTLLMTSACASRPGADPAARDPLEAYNRGMYKFNVAFDKVTLKPAAKAYNAVTPAPMRHGVDNAVQNLQEPLTIINSLLQGNITNMFHSMSRFLVNSTLGFGGFADRASEWKIPKQDEDFGQTLAVWGVPEGPYVMLPFLGPSNPRDTLGIVTEFFGDPVSYGLRKQFSRYASWTRKGIEIGNFRAKALTTIDPVLADSDDPYVTVRSAYRQKRAFEISNGADSANKAVDDIFDQPETTPSPPPPASQPPKSEQQSSLQSPLVPAAYTTTDVDILATGQTQLP